ncbi:50S ribosomal protein L25/general stress protein Ctc [Desertihabitans aurantiacus]|uniref:50S ribosomal protein L25/general stress protein Ctc n=1 Tax=Desertihabitans aurantiacus TaxID=2282477 RepID=UPI000DF7CF4F|nr:50S ribosomal protein L25/general stress protein Ctc [Desertihabitans aurantiacus]
MSEIKLQAELRTEFGKGAARRVRRADRVPAVIYGHGTDPVHISLPGHETLLALRNANALLSVDIEGRTELVLPKQVQRDPIKGFLEHVDLVVVRRGEKVSVEVPVQVVGEAGPDTLVVLDTTVIGVQAPATHIPDAVEVSVEGLAAGTQVLASDLTLPGDVTLDVDADLLIVNVTGAPTTAQVEAELADAEADAGIEPTVGEEAETAGATAEGGSSQES